MDIKDASFGGLISQPQQLQAWFDSEVPGTTGKLEVSMLRGGLSNVLFKVQRGSETFAIRRPPAISNDVSANNLLREIRLLRALANTKVPHSRLIAASTETQIMGTPFEVLEWIDGFTPFAPLPEPMQSSPRYRREFGFALIDGLADVAKVDWRGVGLEGFGKPEGFLERQVDRWLGQLERYRTRDIEQLDAVVKWLRESTPLRHPVGLLHGDYSPANVMVAPLSPDSPLKLAAIVDWESATIGDPLLDLGQLISGWQDDTSGPTWAIFADWKGLPSRQEAIERYAQRSGLNVDRLDYYMVLAIFKIALIMEGAYYRWKTGKSNAPEHAAMETLVPQMMLQAARIIETS